MRNINQRKVTQITVTSGGEDNLDPYVPSSTTAPTEPPAAED